MAAALVRSNSLLISDGADSRLLLRDSWIRLSRISVLECASPLALWESWKFESARGLVNSKTWRWDEWFMWRKLALFGRTGQILACTSQDFRNKGLQFSLRKVTSKDSRPGGSVRQIAF